ncbi:MAG: patatin-like phospholipase family protein [Bacilli bacterium]|nr:patatin-like phospholipase family protein [Bacilli bacterium]
MEKMKKINHIGIVFSGGFSRGAAQLAFANEIIKKIGYKKITVLTGSSIGALNAYAVASKKANELIDFYKNFDCESVLRFRQKLKNDLYGNIFNLIESDKLVVPLYVTATKFPSFIPHYFCLNTMKRNDAKKVLNCSSAFPLINGPQRFNYTTYIDGGSTDNVPIYPLKYFNLDMVIILHCYNRYYPPLDLFNKNTIVIDSDVTLNLNDEKTPFSFTRADMIEMINAGKRSGQQFADLVFKDFNFNSVKARCRAYINNNLEKRKNKNDKLMAVVQFCNFLYQFKENS